MESQQSNLAWSIVSQTPAQMEDLRLIDLNLIYAIKEKFLPLHGYTSKITETLGPGTQEVDPVTGLPVTPYQGTQYDWVYYNPDPSNPTLTGLITIPILSTSGNLAYVDYPNGKVYYSGVQSSNITVTYDYYSVYVQDGYPDWGDDIKNWPDIRIPLVSVDFSKRMNTPFYIGGTYQEDRIFVVDILGNSDAQRDDISDMIENQLKFNYKETINYSYGFPLKFNGDINPTFDRGPATRWKEIRFQGTNSHVVRNPMEEDKFRHRSIINSTIRTIK